MKAETCRGGPPFLVKPEGRLRRSNAAAKTFAPLTRLYRNAFQLLDEQHVPLQLIVPDGQQFPSGRQTELAGQHVPVVGQQVAPASTTELFVATAVSYAAISAAEKARSAIIIPANAGLVLFVGANSVVSRHAATGCVASLTRPA